MMASPTFLCHSHWPNTLDKCGRRMYVLPSYVATEIVGNFEL